MNDTEGRQMRQRIGEAIQENGPILEPGEDVVATITGWVVVAEWMASNGLRWLSTNSGDACGEILTTWAMNGMLHEALHGEWSTSDPDAEEGE